MFRDRAGRRATAAGSACSRLTTADLPGFGDRRADNRPRLRNGEHGQDVEHRPCDSPRGGGRARPARPGPHGAVGRPDGLADPRDGRRRHLRRADLRQRVPPRAERAGARQGHGLRHRHARAAAGHRPRCGAGVRREVTNNIDLAPTFEELAGLRPARFRSGVSLVPTFADRRAVRRSYAFFEHTQQTLTGGDPDAAYTGGELDLIPSYIAVRSRTGLLVRLDLDPAARGTTWGYEFYSYRQRAFEARNQFASPKRARRGRRADGQVEGLRQVPRVGQRARLQPLPRAHQITRVAGSTRRQRPSSSQLTRPRSSKPAASPASGCRPSGRGRLGVADDVVEVLDRRARDGVPLVVGRRRADPAQPEPGVDDERAEVGVLAAVADVVLAEAAGAPPGGGGARRRTATRTGRGRRRAAARRAPARAVPGAGESSAPGAARS